MSLIYSPEKMQIDLGGKLIRLTTKEAAVMKLLWESNGEVCSVDDFGVFIYGTEWYNLDISIGSIEKLISRIRKKIAPYGQKFIKNLSGVGWYFEQQEVKSTPKPVIDFDVRKRTIIVQGKTIHLTALLARAMEILYEGDGEVISDKKIWEFVYGYENDFSPGMVHQLMSRLRRRLGEYSENLQTVPGAGWYFQKTVKVQVTPTEAILLRYFRSLSPIEQEMVMASQALSSSSVPKPQPVQPPQPSLFDTVEAKIQ